MPALPSFKPGQVWLDTNQRPIQAHGGGILHHEGVYYWFGEDKDAPTEPSAVVGTRLPALGVRCYSSRDLHAWRDEGIALATDDDQPTADLRPANVVERPKVLYHAATRTFVLWFHMDRADYMLAAVGVATATSPTGPYRYLGSTRPGGHDSRDCTVFAEGAQAWLFHSAEWNQTLHARPLAPTWLHPEPGQVTRVFPGASREAPALFAHAGRYYLFTSGCTGWDPNPTDVGVADHLAGPWRSLGNPCRGPDADTTFRSQSTFVLPVADRPGKFIALFDRWNKENLGDSRYVWLPVEWEGELPVVRWRDEWDLSIFD